MKLYISSRMTGIPEHNFPEFYKVAEALAGKGHEVINPAVISEKVLQCRDLHDCPAWKDFMKEDIKYLIECEGIVMFGDYWKSSGAMLEFLIAKGLDMKIYRFCDETKDIRPM